jgi:hypothetical protein
MNHMKQMTKAVPNEKYKKHINFTPHAIILTITFYDPPSRRSPFPPPFIPPSRELTLLPPGHMYGL